MIKPLVHNAQVGTCLSKGWKIYKENFGLILLATLITGLISFFTCNICAGPMLCGLFGILLALIRGQEQKPKVGDLFKGFSKFLPAFLVTLVLFLCFTVIDIIFVIVPLLGLLADLLLCFLYPTIMVLAILLVADQNATFGEAFSTPLNMIGKKPFWSFFLVVFVASLIAGLGFMLCGIGLLFTMPIFYCMVAAAYDEAIGGGDASPATPPAPEAEAPASPSTPEAPSAS